MELLKRAYAFLCKLWSIKVALFIVATFALYHSYISEWVWFGTCLLLIGGREVSKILAQNLSLRK